MDFADLATESCESSDLLLLSVAAEFRPVRWDEALERLDDLGRRVFGIAALTPPEAAGELARALTSGAGLRPDAAGIEGLLLDCVLRDRRGHPALLAFIFCEAARRAGVAATVYSDPYRWYAGVRDDEGLVLVDPAGWSPQAAAVPARLRPHCGHELAWMVLCGVEGRLRRSGAERTADRAAALRELLPVRRHTPDAGRDER